MEKLLINFSTQSEMRNNKVSIELQESIAAETPLIFFNAKDAKTQRRRGYHPPLRLCGFASFALKFLFSDCYKNLLPNFSFVTLRFIPLQC